MRWDSWEAIALLVLCAAAVLSAVWLHYRFWSKRLTLVSGYSTEEELETEDGATIELRRLEPSGAADRELPPVLLVHGVAANHRNNDLGPKTSLARYLAEAGRDVWLLTLRSGIRARGSAARQRVRFSNRVRYDLPLAVATVRERTGAERVDYVGFSMGGMLLYAAIGRTVPTDHVRRVGIIGSPAVVKAPWPIPIPRWLARIPGAVAPSIKLRSPGIAYAFAAEWFATPFHHLVYNPRNMDRGVARQALVNVIQDIPGPLNMDFASWLCHDGQIRVDGELALPGLAKVNVPVYFQAGTADKLAPPASVRAAYEAWGADLDTIDKRFAELGRAHGTEQDYGHGDLAVGARVASEVFEPMRAFLAEP